MSEAEERYKDVESNLRDESNACRDMEKSYKKLSVFTENLLEDDRLNDERQVNAGLRRELELSRLEHKKSTEQLRKKHEDAFQTMRRTHEDELSRLEKDHKINLFASLHKERQKKQNIDTTVTINNTTTVSKHSFSVANIQKLAAIHRKRLQRAKKKHKEESNHKILAAIHRERQRHRVTEHKHENETSNLRAQHQLKMFASLHAERQKVAQMTHAHKNTTDDIVFASNVQKLAAIHREGQRHRHEEHVALEQLRQRMQKEHEASKSQHELKLFASLHAERQRLKQLNEVSEMNKSRLLLSLREEQKRMKNEHEVNRSQHELKLFASLHAERQRMKKLREESEMNEMKLCVEKQRMENESEKSKSQHELKLFASLHAERQRMRKLNEEHSNTKHVMKQEYENMFRNLQLEHEANVSEIRAKHEHAVAAMQRKHDAHVRAVKSKHLLDKNMISEMKNTKLNNLENRLTKFVTKRVEPRVMKWYSRIKDRRAELRYLCQELLDTEIHLVSQMNFMQRCYVNELRRRVKHHKSNHLHSIRNNKMSKSSPTLSGSLNFEQKKKKTKKRSRRDSEFYKPGTEVRVICKGKWMFQTGTVVHRHYDEEEENVTKKNEIAPPVTPPRPGDGEKKDPPPVAPPRPGNDGKKGPPPVAPPRTCCYYSSSNDHTRLRCNAGKNHSKQ